MAIQKSILVACALQGIGSFHLNCQTYTCRVFHNIPLLSFLCLVRCVSNSSRFISDIGNLCLLYYFSVLLEVNFTDHFKEPHFLLIFLYFSVFNLIDSFILKIIFIYLFLERGGGKEKEGGKHWCAKETTCNPGMCPDWKSVGNLSLCLMMTNQVSHTGQGSFIFYLLLFWVYFTLLFLGFWGISLDYWFSSYTNLRHFSFLNVCI